MIKRILKLKKTWVILVCVLLTVVWIRSCRKKEDTGKKEYALKLKKRLFTVKIQATGVVEPENRVPVMPLFGGRIEEVLVREGDDVEKGQVLAWMSSNERAALLDSARVRGAGEDELKRFEKAYNLAPLVAPISGKIIKRAVEPGQPVTASKEVLVISDRLIIRTSVDETDIGALRQGQKAEYVLDAFPKDACLGKVLSIAYDASLRSNVTVYDVKVLPFTCTRNLRSGMTADVHIITRKKPDTLCIPKRAVKYKDGNPTVKLPPGPDGKSAVRTVKIGLTDRESMEILDGLEEGETIMVSTETAKDRDRTMTLSISN